MIGTRLVKRLTHTNKFTRYHDWYTVSETSHTQTNLHDTMIGTVSETSHTHKQIYTIP